MRPLPVAILVSVGSHALTLSLLAWSASPRAMRLGESDGGQTSEAVSGSAALAPEPIGLVLLDDRTAPGAEAPPVVVRRQQPSRAVGGARAVDNAAREPAAVAAGVDRPGGPLDEPSSTPARSAWLVMRRPAQPELRGLSQGFADELVARSKPLAPLPDTPERLLEERNELRRGHGSVAQIVALNEQIARQDLKPSGGGTYRAEQATFIAKVDVDGSVQLEDKPHELDSQDRLMVRMGSDPYARNKLALLDRTRDQRVAVGERHRHVQLGRAAELMQRNLDRLWATAPDLAARKRGLFELWDDCAEDGSDELVAGAAAARGLVIGAIRARLRGADAYTAAELVALNATRRSTAMFAPYE